MMIRADEYCLKVFDGTHDSPKPSEVGFPLITSKNISKNELDFDSAYLISKKDFDQINKRSLVKKWDVLFTMIGTVGEVLLIENIDREFAIKNVGVFSCENEFRAKWIFYYLHSPFAKKYIKHRISGAVQKFVGLEFLRTFPIPAYDHNKNFIIKILSDIDKKISINRTLNGDLESIAKLIYDYWFVQFDFPDINRKPYKSSGGKMIYNNDIKRLIPESWYVRTLSEIEKNIITGKTPSTKEAKNYNGNIPFICIGDVRGNIYITETEQYLTELGANTQANKFIPEDAICVSCIATTGLVGFSTEKSQTNQQLNSVVCSSIENKNYLYFYLKDYFRFSKAKIGNTFSNMNKGEFSSIKCILPDNSLLKSFHKKTSPLFDKIKIISKENKELRKMRNWLLPMLMNGQVKVS